MLIRARSRAKDLGREFTVTVGYIVIPEVCPVLGTPLVRNLGEQHGSPDSPSIDRIDNSKGPGTGGGRHLTQTDAAPSSVVQWAITSGSVMAWCAR
jgi:hypothetical protein